MIRFEHPLTERIRTLLRLEDLFEKVAFFSAREDAIEHHAALDTLFEILDVTGRTDMKSDLLQELERQKQALEVLRKNPDVSEEALDHILGEIQTSFHNMLHEPGKFGEHLRENEWLMSIKQRAGLPGGVCEFDHPSYHHWLHLDASQRRHDLCQWVAPLLSFRDSFRIILRLLRDSGKTFRHTARRGMFQQMGPGRAAHMLCVEIAGDLPCVPEISANKYALTIRFVVSGARQKTRLYEEDVDFTLSYCNL